MDFRRIPFQFSSTDPVKRQAELQKRFGLPDNSKSDKMHLDFANSELMGSRPEGKSFAASSPRLQHRVPVFVEGASEPMMSSVDSQGSPVVGRKPHVRVVPIEIEGVDASTQRHRNFSGPTNNIKDRRPQNGSWLPEEFTSYVRPSMVDPKPKQPASGERTIPVQVEGVQSKKAKTVPVQKPKSANPKEAPKRNGCSAPKVHKPVNEPKKPSIMASFSLKKIEGILQKLKTYHADVEKFSGTVKEKQYRYLDEMLTRLMLELDDIDTMGNEEVRLSRKAAVKQVQASVDLLEARVTRETTEQTSKEDKPADEFKDVEMELCNSQDENVMVAVPGPDDSSKPSAESTSEIVQQLDEKVEDVEMANNVPGEQKIQAPVGTDTTIRGDPLVMEVDESVVTEPGDSPDKPIAKQNISEMDEVVDVQIEELESAGDTLDEKEIDLEPVVILADEAIKTDIEINNVNDVPVEPSVLQMETQLLDASECAKETTKSSPDVICEKTSNLECDNLVTSEHSKLTDSNIHDIVSNDPLAS